MAPTSKPLPNGGSSAPDGAKITVRRYEGPDLRRAFLGKAREPSPFDDAVAAYKASGETAFIDLPPSDRSPERRKALVQQLHRAAKLHETGLDIWANLDDGIAFRCRERRTRKVAA
jgi:hypothetical protein